MISQQMQIYKHPQITNCYSSPTCFGHHVSNIRVSNDKNTINIVIIVQKCTEKTTWCYTWLPIAFFMDIIY